MYLNKWMDYFQYNDLGNFFKGFKSEYYPLLHDGF